MLLILHQVGHQDGFLLFCFLLNSQNEELKGHIHICWKAGESSVFSDLSSEQSYISLQGEDT